MDVKKININQTEPTYYIASDIYDVSARNNDATFESLQSLLSSDNLSTLIPTAVRSGGMTIRFVQSSDNKYVQYRLMSNDFSTTVSDWQGVDDVPTAESDNLVKSGGVFLATDYIGLNINNTFIKNGAIELDVIEIFENKILSNNGVLNDFTGITTTKYSVNKGDALLIDVNDAFNKVYGVYALYDESDKCYKVASGGEELSTGRVINVPKNGTICISSRDSGKRNSLLKLTNFDIEKQINTEINAINSHFLNESINLIPLYTTKGILFTDGGLNLEYDIYFNTYSVLPGEEYSINTNTSLAGIIYNWFAFSYYSSLENAIGNISPIGGVTDQALGCQQ